MIISSKLFKRSTGAFMLSALIATTALGGGINKTPLSFTFPTTIQGHLTLATTLFCLASWIQLKSQDTEKYQHYMNNCEDFKTKH